jgi:hypothetical protein
MKKNEQKTVIIIGTIRKSNRIFTETGNIDTPNMHIYKISFMGEKLLLGE